MLTITKHRLSIVQNQISELFIIVQARTSLALSQPKIPKPKRTYFLRTRSVSRKISVNKRGKQRRQILALCEEARANVTDGGGERASKRSAASGIIVRL